MAGEELQAMKLPKGAKRVMTGKVRKGDYLVSSLGNIVEGFLTIKTEIKNGTIGYNTKVYRVPAKPKLKQKLKIAIASYLDREICSNVFQAEKLAEGIIKLIRQHNRAKDVLKNSKG
jgi:hypothetical protein